MARSNENNDNDDVRAQNDWDTIERRRWHISREVSLALFLAIMLQTVGAVWSLAGLYSKVDSITAAVAELKNERYTKEDAKRDQDLMMLNIKTIREYDTEIAGRLRDLEKKMNQHELDQSPHTKR